jgi:hypothetical protein
MAHGLKAHPCALDDLGLSLKPFLPLSGTLFLVRMRFSSAPKTGLARESAQSHSRRLV